ncbi:Sensor histidine kinase VraS [Streptococcus sp. DD10]|uniref:sensor histidine kinase n=1 Tax=Streptococcus sp. DD10 TaxID=1777878 RepID=UPI0007948060|nr:sensor histidine kinase [Streptococcus sp. DD10]KXT73742.1 Sensor histidine kinase VraS [Streptococcus sp. DD10]
MKRKYLFLLFFYSSLVLGMIVYYLFTLFDISWQQLIVDFNRLQRFIFFILTLSFGLMLFLVILIKLIEFTTTISIQRNLKAIIEGKDLQKLPQEELNSDLKRISEKLTSLTESLQKSENQELHREEEIVEKERNRIARDLHDTVSQELFAANLILSGVEGQIEELQTEQLKSQIRGVSDILETAQKDLRVLLLHLRPTELEGRSLVAGFQVLVNELRDKSNMEVVFEHQVQSLPKQIEEHIFRIAQEIISNTLRHAKANRLDIFLIQRQHELQLKMTDNGVGFNVEQATEMSYGLKNIKDRVLDMAGSVKILTAPKKGVAIDIRVPLLD